MTAVGNALAGQAESTGCLAPTAAAAVASLNGGSIKEGRLPPPT